MEGVEILQLTEAKDVRYCGKIVKAYAKTLVLYYIGTLKKEMNSLNGNFPT
jgi:hypothetical protein